MVAGFVLASLGRQLCLISGHYSDPVQVAAGYGGLTVNTCKCILSAAPAGALGIKRGRYSFRFKVQRVDTGIFAM